MRECAYCNEQKPAEGFKRGERRCRDCRLSYLAEQRRLRAEREGRPFKPHGRHDRPAEEKWEYRHNQNRSMRKNHPPSRAPRRKSDAYEMTHSQRSKYLRWGLIPEDFETIIEAQDGKCTVCWNDFDDARQPVVDHDHSCCAAKRSCGNCLRGVICSKCNIAIGFVESAVGNDALSYLDQTRGLPEW